MKVMRNTATELHLVLSEFVKIGYGQIHGKSNLPGKKYDASIIKKVRKFIHFNFVSSSFSVRRLIRNTNLILWYTFFPGCVEYTVFCNLCQN